LIAQPTPAQAPVRRAPTDLPIAFADEAFVRRVSAANGEPDWRLEDRLQGLQLFQELAPETNRLFTTYLDYRPIDLSGVRPYEAVASPGRYGAPSADGDRLPEGASAFLHVHEGAMVSRVLSPEAAEGGLFLGTFDEASDGPAEALRGRIESGTSLPDDDKLAQLTRAAYGVGILCHAPAGLVLEAPIVIRWSVGADGRGLLSRTVVILEEGAQAKVLEELDESAGRPTADGAQALWTGTSEVALGPSAILDVASLGELGPRTVAFVNRHAELAEQAQLRWAIASVGGAFVKSRIDNRLVGRGSGVGQVEIVFGSGDQHFDLTSYTRHVGEDTTSDLLSKGVLQERSRNYLKGLITIERSARGTDTFLGEFGMLLGKKSRSVAIPALEIDQPFVRRASHSSSVGPLDENQLFYLESRGIERETARKMIVLAFLEPVVARIPLPAAQERLRGLLDAKWLPALPETVAAAEVIAAAPATA
jgi:Fe-S cluster assembly scaffold protein SufB